MLHRRTSPPVTDATIFHFSWGAWSGWAFVARDRELRFESLELPPPLA